MRSNSLRPSRPAWATRAAAAALAALAVLAAFPAAAAPAPAPAWNLTIFHTNDMHSAFWPRPAAWRDDGRPVGGVVALSAHLAAERRSAAPDLLLDAGDFMTGNPVSRLREDGIPGAAVIRVLNALGYDAGAIGNHEFDLGHADLARLVPLVRFPLLAADLRLPDGGPAFGDEPLVLERGGLRVGVIGVSCATMTEVVTPGRLGPVTLADQAETVRARAAALDPGTDLIVLLTHNGVQGDRALARRLEGAGVDVIVGGHSHTRLTEPEVEAGIIIVQAGGNLTNLGRLDLRVEDDRVVAHAGRLVDLWADDGTAPLADPAVAALAARYGQEVQREFGRVVGTLAQDLRRGRGETGIGNFLADALRLRAGADVGLINGGGIRKNLPAGPVTALDVHEVLPFGNALVTASLTGAQLRTVVQTNADAAVGGDHGILQISGLAYVYRKATQGPGAELVEITVGGQPLDPERVYTVAMPDFVAQMTGTYLGIGPVAFRDGGETVDEAVVAEFARLGTVTAAIEGRIVRLEPQD
ncbi:MAG: bifunctional UDP-sugar hydrolase/5'-nucleotidase [Candidatus Krumholzibacteriia bacterium]